MELFWRRAIYDPQYKRLFCLVNAEELSSIVCDSALHSLFELSQAQQGIFVTLIFKLSIEFTYLMVWERIQFYVVCLDWQFDKVHAYSN